MNTQMNTKERLKEIMEAKSFNLKTFSELADIPYRTLQNYILSGREPSAEALMKLYKHLNINLNWLLSGKGGMFHDISNPDLTEREQDLINHYRKMPNDTQMAFDTIFKNLTKR